MNVNDQTVSRKLRAFLLLCTLLTSCQITLAQINVLTTWDVGWGPLGGPDTAGLDTAKLPNIPERFGNVSIGDLDGDGDKDFVSGSNRGTFHYYQNQGTSTSPVWVLSNAIPSLDSIDIAPNQNTNEVRAELFDIDNDGDLDLMAHSRWAYNGFYKLDDIHFYRNIGSSTNPIFQFDTISGLQFQQTGEFGCPSFVDLDNDGDYDMVTGGSDTCSYFENIGTNTSPAFSRKFGLDNPFSVASGWVELSFLAPTVDFEDFDNDGDFDLYFMNEAGFVRYIPNNGTSSLPDFSPFLSYPAHSFDTVDFGAFGAIDFEDVTGDGVKDLLATHWNPTRWYWYKGIDPGPNVSLASSNITCNGLSNGSISASVSSGVSPFTYLWSNGATTATISNLSSGTYTITVTDNNGYSTIKSWNLIEPASLTPFVVVDSTVTCFGYATGGATASATGGTTPYTYTWSNASTTASITGVVAGTYTVTITDNNGCTGTYFRTVTQKLPLQATTIVDSNSTGGISNGGLTTSATGGTTPYNYLWSNGATTTSITGLSVGTYTVTISDINGCSTTDSESISSLTANTVVDSNITCNGNSNGGATVTPIGGTAPYSYTWSNGATTGSITGVIAGIYSVTVTDDNGITATSTATITEPATLIALSIVDSNTTCNGFSNGGASASATGGTSPYNYAWSNAATTASITGVVAGTYTVTITDNNGCTSTSFATITEPASLIAASVVDSNSTCNGFSNGGASASATGGTPPYNYAWSNAATTASITGVVAGTYTVTITDNNGCTSTSSSTITEPASLIAASVVDSNSTCNGFSDGGASASVTGGTPPYTYVWSNAATTASITGVVAGTYSVTITDNNGCTSTSSSTVTEPAALIAASVVDSNSTCNGFSNGGASASATGGTTPYNYLWSNAATTASITGVVAGTYTVTITDNNGCTSTSSATITEPAALLATSIVDSNSTCNGFSNGGASASATGGTSPYSYAWSNAATTASITGVVAGTYTVTITDNNGCTSTSSSTVTEPAVLVAASVVDSNATCNGFSDGGASASALGGTSPYTYAWSNAATTTSITSVAAGTYTVTITDNNGCTSTSSATVTEPAALITTSVVDSNSTCNGFSNGGASASATGGTSPYTYAWSNAATTASITGVVAGTYSVTITDNNGCTSTSSSTVTEPAALIATSVVDSNSTCNGFSNGGASASATGGTAPYSYAWSNAATTATITGVVAGTYTVTITDNNGCTSTSSAMVTEPTALIATSVVDSNATCNGFSDGGASASAMGGTAPYTYAWSNAATTASISGVVAGTYTVTITDNNGCTSTSSSTVTEPAVLVAATVVDSNATCNGFSNGGASASATGGTAPYNYLWSNAATTASITGVVAGTYTVTITDNNGCTSTSSSMITEPTVLVSTTVVDSNVTCNGFSDGGASASATGGTAPYSYAWSNTATTASITAVVAGTYTVTITDNNGCTSSSSVTIAEPTLLVSTTVVDSNATCDALANGGATVAATGGTTPYTYLWSTSETSTSITSISAGNYDVTVTDANGCLSTSSVVITSNNSTASAFTINECTSYTSPSGIYNWTTSGVYNDTISNVVGCDSVLTITLNINANSFSQTATICKGETYSVGTNNYTVAGVYTDVLTNVAGCDSTITTTLLVDTVDVSITQNVYELTANNNLGTYQWIDCDNNNQPIVGETNQSYTATVNGNFAVVITEGTCSDTSECIQITGIGITELSTDFGITLFPNPSSDVVNVKINSQENLNLIVRDMAGKEVYLRTDVSDKFIQIDVNNFESGVYFIEFNNGQQKQVKRLITF